MDPAELSNLAVDKTVDARATACPSQYFRTAPRSQHPRSLINACPVSISALM